MDLNIEVFEDLYKRITFLSTADIIKTIESFKYRPIPLRDNKIEYGYGFPRFVDSFYDFIIEHKRIPNQDEFFNYYIIRNRIDFEYVTKTLDLEDVAYTTRALKARIYRSYPSFIRDVHFVLHLKEFFSCINSINVLYNLKLDTDEGIDILLTYEGKHYGINLFTQTRNAVYARSKKQYRHKQYDNIHYVDLPINLDDCDNCGDFRLYGDREILKILEEIKFIYVE